MEILKKLSDINKEVESIQKTQKNAQQGFMYRGIDQVMNDLHDLFAKHEVIITSEPESVTREERINKNGTALIWTVIKYKFTFHAPDGTNISTTAIGEAMDSGDKGSNKCISVALKYVLFNMFLIPTAEMKDPDGETHEVQPEVKKPEEPDFEAIEAELKKCKTVADVTQVWVRNAHLKTNEDFKILVNRYGDPLKQKEQKQNATN